MKKILPTKITNTVSDASQRINRYKLVLFVLAIAIVYGYIVLTISTLSGAQPTQEQISAQYSPIRSAKIDQKVILQLEQLEDNSSSVRTLFDEARSNPFQEN